MDKKLYSAELSSLPEVDQARLSSLVDDFHVRDSLRRYNALVETCFSECVDSFYRKTLGKQEENCVLRCAEKYLKHSTQVGMLFAELNEDASKK
ncbi:hypothetical protein ACJIZ3_012556 [Penstemon smallii]|uniref:Mitochondrial import inner membrane translocase subunit n=1 Tax=Penstemon smallii TaxID=265156 RepID=A0ABD3UME9_9LAMI